MLESLLVDGSNLARRNFHAQNLTTSTGVRTGLIYGVVNSLLTLQERTPFTFLTFVWDVQGSSSQRKAMFPGYKSGRNQEGLEDYEEDKEFCMQLLDALGIRQVYKKDVECDDIIGYLALETFKDYEVKILSNDKDFYQLISNRICVVKPDLSYVVPDTSGRIWFKDQGKMIAIFPNQITDYKALVGDASDSIPGAVGFGVTAAMKFFSLNKGIEDIISGKAVINNQSSRAVEAIIQAIPFVAMYKDLATIKPEWGQVELPEKPVFKLNKVLAMFEILEFKHFLTKMDALKTLGGE